MKTIKQIEALISAGIAKIEAILGLAKEDDRECTADEQAEITAWVGESDEKPGQQAGLQAELVQAERLDKMIKANQAKLAPQAFADRAKQDGIPPVAVVPAHAQRHGALIAYKDEADAYASGRFIMATMLGDKSAKEWCRANMPQEITAAMSETDNPKGGFLVPQQFESAVIRLVKMYGVAAQFATIHPMSTDIDNIPRRESGLTVYYPGEGGTITDSDVGLGNIKLTAIKRATLTKVSSELTEDSAVSIAELLTQEIALAFAKKQDEDTFLGDGTSTYGGVTGLASALKAGSVFDAASGNVSFATFDFTDFEETIALLPDFADNERTAWFISKSGYAKSMLRLLNAAGGNTKQTLADVNGRQRPMFLDYPVVFTNAMPSTDAVSTHQVYLGDFGQSVALGTRRGVTVVSDSSVYFATDQIGVRATERVAINVHERGTASEAGSIIALKTAAS